MTDRLREKCGESIAPLLQVQARDSGGGCQRFTWAADVKGIATGQQVLRRHFTWPRFACGSRRSDQPAQIQRSTGQEAWWWLSHRASDSSSGRPSKFA